MPKRASIEFIKCADLESTSIRFGGEPFGFPAALWPVSRSQSQPMQFICQIPFGPDLFPSTREAVAYLFMSHGDADKTWDPDAGENALVIVPHEQLTSSITEGEAPRLCRMVKKWWRKKLVPETCAFSARLTPGNDPEFIAESALMEIPDDQAASYRDSLKGNKMGGTPGFLQGDELPFDAPWHLLLQLDSAQVPFWINFGDVGIGYAFLNASGTEGKFLWQCC